ncbi:MAG TPA: bacterial transcriptional activator domain-containing protein [Actinoplanes sp.]
MIEIRLFGTGRVHTAAGEIYLDGADHWRVLQLLAVHRTLSTSTLADLFWDGDAPLGHRAILAGHVAELCDRLGPVVQVLPGGYGLDPARVAVDLWDFDELFERACRLPAGQALPLLERAGDLARRLPFATEGGQAWAAEARARYRDRVVAAATGAARHALTVGAIQRAIQHSTLATDLDPAAEIAWRARMSAQHAAGDRTGALRSFHMCRQILADERGAVPTPATGDLFRRILRARPARRPGARCRASGAAAR